LGWDKKVAREDEMTCIMWKVVVEGVKQKNDMNPHNHVWVVELVLQILFSLLSSTPKSDLY